MSTLLVSTRKGLMEFHQDSAGFKLAVEHFLGDNVSNFCTDSAGHWYVALNLGHFGPKMHFSDDNGSTWQEVACPAFGESQDETVKQIWVLQAHPSEPGRLFAGTIPGALFETKNGAESWEVNQGFYKVPQRSKWFGGGFDESGVHSIVIDKNDSNLVTLAISVGGVWHSEDGGESWLLGCQGMRAEYMPEDMVDADDLQDPHRLVQAPTNPNRMWVQHHCGIFVSDDHGKKWRECLINSQPSFGFAVVVHPHDADTAWFIPAVKDESRFPLNGALKVFKTTDGGLSFNEQTDGLPQKGSFDLIYRHALAVDKTGNQLVFGSTTGNLWMTVDAGNHWQVLSNHMPPIYAVNILP